MAYEFKLPDLGEGLTEGEIGRWLVSEGQEIGEDDPLVEIATDKTTVEIPSPAAGAGSKILAAEGDCAPASRPWAGSSWGSVGMGVRWWTPRRSARRRKACLTPLPRCQTLRSGRRRS